LKLNTSQYCAQDATASGVLTAKRRFPGGDALSTALAQIGQPVPRVPEELKHWQPFFYRALAVDAGHRYPNAAAMRAAIHELRRKSVNTLGRTGMMVGLLVGLPVIGGVAIASRNREPGPGQGTQGDGGEAKTLTVYSSLPRQGASQIPPAAFAP